MQILTLILQTLFFEIPLCEYRICNRQKYLKLNKWAINILKNWCYNKVQQKRYQFFEYPRLIRPISV